MASTSSQSPKTLTLVSSDGEFFVLPESAAVRSATIQKLVNDEGCADNPIPLPNVTGKVLAKVVDYLKIQADESLPADEKKEFNDELVSCDPKELKCYLLAAHYLKIEDLMDFLCRKFADLIMKESLESLRKTFEIQT